MVFSGALPSPAVEGPAGWVSSRPEPDPERPPAVNGSAGPVADFAAIRTGVELCDTAVLAARKATCICCCQSQHDGCERVLTYSVPIPRNLRKWLYSRRRGTVGVKPVGRTLFHVLYSLELALLGPAGGVLSAFFQLQPVERLKKQRKA